MSGLLAVFLNAIVPALGPAIVDGIRGLAGRLFGTAGALPQSVDEQVKLYQAEAAKLQALAALDSPGGAVSPFVANVRGAGRWFAAGAILLGTLYTAIFVPTNPNLPLLGALSEAVWFWLFGEKVYMRTSGKTR